MSDYEFNSGAQTTEEHLYDYERMKRLKGRLDEHLGLTLHVEDATESELYYIIPVSFHDTIVNVSEDVYRKVRAEGATFMVVESNSPTQFHAYYVEMKKSRFWLRDWSSRERKVCIVLLTICVASIYSLIQYVSPLWNQL